MSHITRKTGKWKLMDYVMAVVFAAFIAGLVAVGPLLVMLAWNYGVASVVTVKPLHFWPAVAITFGIGVLLSFARSEKSK